MIELLQSYSWHDSMNVSAEIDPGSFPQAFWDSGTVPYECISWHLNMRLHLVA